MFRRANREIIRLSSALWTFCAASRAGWLTWAAATAAVVALAAMLTSGIVASRYEARLGQMAREMAAERERLQREEAALATYQGVVELLRDPATRVIELRSPSASNAIARLIWNDADGHFTIIGAVRNAFDEEGYDNVSAGLRTQTNTIYQTTTFTPPRMATVEVQFHF